MKRIHVLLTLALVGSLFAEPRQWDLDGVAVRQAYDVQWTGQMARGADGSVLVVWTDARNGHQALCGQMLSPTGTALWGENGRLLAVSEGVGIYWPVVTYSGDGWVVLWQDLDVMNLSEEVVMQGRIKTMKYDADGAPMWSDPEGTGQLVYDGDADSFTENGVWVVSDEANGVYVGWQVESSVYVRRLFADGVAAWENNLVVDAVVNSVRWTLAGVDGNLAIGWLAAGAGEIRCAMIDRDGAHMWAVPELLCNVSAILRDLNLMPDGEGGVIALWLDGRNWPQKHVFGQRVTAEGDLLWSENGSPIVTDGEDRHRLRAARSFTGDIYDGILLNWLEERSDYPMTRVLIQKIDFDGVELWAEGGLETCPAVEPTNNRDAQWLVSDGAGGAIQCYTENDAVWGVNLKLTRVNAAGENPWTECAYVLSGYGTAAPRVLLGANNAVITVWQDVNSNPDLYSHAHELATGEPILDVPQALSHFPSGETQTLAAVELSGDRVAMVWGDDRTSGRDLFFQIQRSDGTVEREVDGEALFDFGEEDGTIDCERPALCQDGTGGFFAVAGFTEDGVRVARVTHRDADGERLGPAEGAVLSNEGNDVLSEAYCVPDRAGGAYVAYGQFDDQYYARAYVMRVDAACQWMWAEPLALALPTTSDDVPWAVVESDNGACIVVWRSGNWPDYQYRAAKVRLDRSVEWSLNVSPIGTNDNDFETTSDGQNGLAATWTLQGDNTPGDVYVQQVSAQGMLRWEEAGFSVTLDELHQYHPKICVDDLGDLIVVWGIYSSTSEAEIRAQNIAPAGQLLWPEEGLSFGPMGTVLDLYGVTATNYENIYIAWQAYSDEEPQPYYTQIMATHVNRLGEVAVDPFWHNENGPSLCEDAFVWDSPQMVPMASGAVTFVWSDNRTSSDPFVLSVYSQRVFDPNPVNAVPTPTLPTEFALAQNYPNPFNPETVIEFALPAAVKTTLKVYDIMGREVVTLVDGVLNAGVQRVSFNAQNLASGVYFYSLKAGEFAMTKKMVVLK